MKKFFFLIVFLSFFSCKKEDTHVSGKITDVCSGAPLGGIKVELWTGEKLSSRHRALLDTMRTWPDGTYQFNFHSVATDGNYWIMGNGFSSDYFSKKETKEFNFTVTNSSGKSDLALKINNISPFNFNDSIYVSCLAPVVSGVYPISEFFRGVSVDTTMHVRFNSCSPSKAYINWWVTKNNTTSAYADSVMVSSGSVINYNINY